jgi:hypothetical protein
VGVDSVALDTIGSGPARGRAAFRLEPEAGELAFFAGLAARGDEGPIFEMPLRRARGRVTWSSTVRWIYRAGFHGRRTSSCFGAQIPERSELEALEARLPEREAIRALRALGFTTIVFDRALDRASVAGEAWRGPRLPAFEREARAADGLLDRLHEGAGLVAFAIR